MRQPRLGAQVTAEGVSFRVWAPQARSVLVVQERSGLEVASIPLIRAQDGYFHGLVPQMQAGDRYRYRVDGAGPYPDPASRFQPEGVHGPSEVVDPSQFVWSDNAWRGITLEEAVIYELHVGTFTEAGTFAAATERLPQLVDLGITAVELMPVADFPGQRNWGYDGVSLFAPARCYGRPEDLRRLVNQAHNLGLAVLLDVVYNHLGPDGNYLRAFSPYYFSKEYSTPWGEGLNFQGEQCEAVREFFMENALHWLLEYHLDGLRLDATHVISDNSPKHFLAELAQRVHATVTDRHVLLIAEDLRNLAVLIKTPHQGGWGLDGVWADDFHHQIRRLLAGDHEGYYSDYSGSVADLARTIDKGWFYCGQYSKHLQAPRGTDPAELPPSRFIICLQNHDQIGNRAMGERLHHQIDLASYRAASALLLAAPQTPLLFMGQEWACSSPFLYFTDHRPELGRLVTQGRRQEFRHFSSFSDPQAQQRIPDPQALSTFIASKLNWAETQAEPHASIRRLYQALLRLRKSEPALRARSRQDYQVDSLAADVILLRRQPANGPALLCIFRLRDNGTIDLREHRLAWLGQGRQWRVLLTTEDPAFAPESRPPGIGLPPHGPVIHFAGPAAVFLRETNA